MMVTNSRSTQNPEDSLPKADNSETLLLNTKTDHNQGHIPVFNDFVQDTIPLGKGNF